jgi:hypothetical protein
MKEVYLLYHVYEYGKELEHESSKELGVYSSLEKAEKAKRRHHGLEGFNKYPMECLLIQKFVIDIDSAWEEGFVSVEEIYEYDKAKNG